MKYHTLLAIFIICLILSTLMFLSPIKNICDEKCDFNTQIQVNVFGVTGNLFGIMIFSFLSILAYLQIRGPSHIKRKTINTATVICSFFAIYFILLEFFVIRTECKYCILLNTSLIIALIITLVFWKH